MKIRNDTKKALVVALRGIKGYEDREGLEPGQTSGDWLNLEEDDIITIEEVKHAQLGRK